MRTSATPTEVTFEIRYRPNPRVLDVRGEWADDLSSHLTLPHWNIVENRVDIFSSDKQDHAFVSFRNAGMVVQNPPTENYFSDKAVRFVKRLLSFPVMGSSLHVERIGLRYKQAIPYDLTFEALVAQLTASYIRLSPELETAMLGARLEDMGAPLNFVDSVGHFNTVVGPMKEEQFKQSFRSDQNLPAVGVFVDVDYWDQPRAIVSGADIANRVASFARSASARAHLLRTVALSQVHVEA